MGIIIDGVQCYGEVEENSNFHVVLEEENEDFEWLDGNPITNSPFNTWVEVVNFFKVAHNDLLEIEAM